MKLVCEIFEIMKSGTTKRKTVSFSKEMSFLGDQESKPKKSLFELVSTGVYFDYQLFRGISPTLL